ncbi:uncharacterized protein LOC118347995 [Juglans regia]|uniref:Uncharacterized protein LOC118347995 n=1 Tax=Juglans regia TaxID=51240 RepID=A0A6P9EKQ7_JUGRE|nr:uncharacterized protein LOC118347995 [Juglans regia]
MPKVRIPCKVCWEKLPKGWLKLNVDGSCRVNLGSCGGGGIIRDSVGNMKAAFSEKFKLGTNNGAELRAIIRGIRLCKELDIRIFVLKVIRSWWWVGSFLVFVLFGTYGIFGND